MLPSFSLFSGALQTSGATPCVLYVGGEFVIGGMPDRRLQSGVYPLGRLEIKTSITHQPRTSRPLHPSARVAVLRDVAVA